MSDTDPLKPSVSTSTVPLKKETVRISLRAQPDESGPIAPRGTGAPIPADATGPTTPISSGDSGSLPTQPLRSEDSGNLPTQPLGAPSAPPSSHTGSILPPAPPAPLKAAAPTPPPAPLSAPRPPSAPSSPGAPTPPPPPAGIPLSKGPDPLAPTRPVSTGPDPLGPTVPVVLPAAPIAQGPPVAPAGPPRPPGPPAAPAGAAVGAKTIPLVKSPQGPSGPGPVGRVTTPLQPGGGARPLPPATVKLDKPTAVGATSGRLAPRSEQRPLGGDLGEEEDSDLELVDAGLMPFAIIVLILSIAVLAIEALTKFGASS